MTPLIILALLSFFGGVLNLPGLHLHHSREAYETF
jgi:hypothetical protein